MRQPGRRSSAALSVVTPLRPHVRRLQPPADLDEVDGELFRTIVRACPPEHFAAGDVPLLATYCQAIRISRREASASAGDVSRVATWEKTARVVAALATRLRLSPHSRTDPKSAARRAAEHRPPSYYDEENE